MSFYETLTEMTATERRQLLAAPIIHDCLQGRVRKASYLAFLAQAYHHVRHTTPLLMLLGGRLPERLAWLRKAVAEYIEEEIGHEEWILNDIGAAGGDPAAVRASAPDLPAELMVAYAYDLVNRGNPAGFFGMVYVLEGTSVALALNAADLIQASLGLPDGAFTYLRSHGEHRLLRPSGEVRWIAVHGSTTCDSVGRPLAMRGICLDITAVKAAEEAERQAAAQLKELAAKQFALQEAERQALSRELHDEVGQSLAALQFTLESLRRKLAGDPACLADLRAANAITAGLVDVTKHLARRLRPPILDELGLAASLRWFIGQLPAGGQPSLRLEQSVGSRRFDPPIELAAFRTVQGAVGNALRHAQASAIVVGLWIEEGALWLSVQDDGVGFDLREAAERSRRLTSLGLLSMRERAEAAGGELRVDSAPGAGTVLTLWFPLRAVPGA